MENITFKILSSKIGSPPDIVEQPINAAIDTIRTQMRSKNKWLFVDGIMTFTDDVTEELLINAEDITLTPELTGGY